MSIDTAMDRLRAANPAPDTRLLREESEDLAVLLATTWKRSTNMQTTQPRGVKPPQRQRRRGWLIAAAAFAVVIVVGLTAALFTNASTDGESATPAAESVTPTTEPVTPTAGPVTFRLKLNLADPPVRGTFVVDKGADILGCSSGAVVYTRDTGTFGDAVMTCESGSNAGTFTIYYGREVFVWNVLESSDDFAGLQGEGSWDFLLTGESTVVETFTGDIEYTP